MKKRKQANLFFKIQFSKAPSDKRGRTFFLSVEKADERDEWVDAIKSWIGYVDANTAKQSALGVVSESGVQDADELASAVADADVTQESTGAADDNESSTKPTSDRSQYGTMPKRNNAAQTDEASPAPSSDR